MYDILDISKASKRNGVKKMTVYNIGDKVIRKNYTDKQLISFGTVLNVESDRITVQWDKATWRYMKRCDQISKVKVNQVLPFTEGGLAAAKQKRVDKFNLKMKNYLNTILKNQGFEWSYDVDDADHQAQELGYIIVEYKQGGGRLRFKISDKGYDFINK